MTVGAPKKPLKNLKINKAVMLGARAHPRLKTQKRRNVRRKTGTRPRISERGAKIRGPVAKPRRKVVIPSVAVVLLVLRECVMEGIAVVWMLEVKVTVAVMRTRVRVADHFLSGGQFWGVSWCRRYISGGEGTCSTAGWNEGFPVRGVWFCGMARI